MVTVVPEEQRHNHEDHNQHLDLLENIRSQRVRVFENKLLRIIFGPKIEEITGKLRKLHNEELHNLFLLFILK
jgi:hypothetical protein